MQKFQAAVKTARDSFSTVIDSVVTAFNPQAGAERLAMRQIIAGSERRMSSDYDRDGIGDKASRLDGNQRWLGSRLSADSELEQDLDSIRQRSAELYRTSTAGGAVDTLVDHVVGTGFTYRPGIVAQDGITEAQATAWNQQLLTCHNRWSKRCDITGRKSLWSLTRLQQRSVAVSGESFTILWAKKRKNHHTVSSGSDRQRTSQHSIGKKR